MMLRHEGDTIRILILLNDCATRVHESRNRSHRNNVQEIHWCLGKTTTFSLLLEGEVADGHGHSRLTGISGAISTVLDTKEGGVSMRWRRNERERRTTKTFLPYIPSAGK